MRAWENIIPAVKAARSLLITQTQGLDRLRRAVSTHQTATSAFCCSNHAGIEKAWYAQKENNFIFV